MYRSEDAGAGGYGFDAPKAATGSAVAAGRSFADIVGPDAELPPMLRSNPKPFQPKVRVCTARYTDPAFVDREVENIWSKCWQVACREEDIPNVGDRITYDIVDASFLIVRTAPGAIKAFYNSCPHRGRRLCDHSVADLNASTGEIRCAFHAWTWDLSGSLQWLPGESDFPHVQKPDYRLREVRCDRWGGNVFINPDEQAPPLHAALGVFTELFADFPLEERYTVLHLRKKVRCNWKVAQEAFMEGYHVVETHWDGMPFFASSSTRYDVWDDGVAHVNRLCTPSSAADGWVADRVSPYQTARQMCAAFGLPEPSPDEVRTLADARRYCADAKRQYMLATYGKDYSAAPDSVLLEMTKAFVFPNHHPWWGEALPWWYRFLPVGRDPDASIMEVRILAPLPADGSAPPPPVRIDLDFDDCTADCEALGSVGHILNQDMQNMEQVQRGLKAAPPGRGFMTLGNYQESNIRHFHHVYNKLLGIPA